MSLVLIIRHWPAASRAGCAGLAVKSDWPHKMDNDRVISYECCTEVAACTAKLYCNALFYLHPSWRQAPV